MWHMYVCSYIHVYVCGTCQAGQVVPVQVTVGLINKAIQDNLNMSKNLFVLDGFPR